MDPHIAEIGQLLRHMEGVNPYLPVDILSLLMKIHQRELEELRRCPACSRGHALTLTREAPAGSYLDVLRCRYCSQIVLELSEARRRAGETS